VPESGALDYNQTISPNPGVLDLNVIQC